MSEKRERTKRQQARLEQNDLRTHDGLPMPSLPHAVRAWSDVPNAKVHTPNTARPEKHITLYTNGELIAALIGKTDGWTIERRYIAGLTTNADASLHARAYRRGAGDDTEPVVWSNGVAARIISLKEMRALVYRLGYDDGAQIVAARMPHTLAVLAERFEVVRRGKLRGAFRLRICTYLGGPHVFRPAITTHQLAPHIVTVQFDATKGKTYRGDFLDPLNLAYGLTGKRRDLKAALSLFSGPGPVPSTNAQEPEPVEGADRCLRGAADVVALTKAAVGLFDFLHPVSRGSGGQLSESRVFSPSAIARSYLAAAEYRAPKMTDEIKGLGAATFFGPFTRTSVRDEVPTVEADFRRQYVTSWLLQNLQRLFEAERLILKEATEEIRALVENFDMENPVMRRQLPALCEVELDGEVVPARMNFSDRGSFSLAASPRASDQPVILALSHVIAAKYLGQSSPKILRAWKIVPKGRQRLRPTRLFGGVEFDPRQDQLVKLMIEEGRRLELGLGQYAGIPKELRTELNCGVKMIGNMMVYGLLMEAPQEHQPAVDTLLFDGGEQKERCIRPEKPGPYACPLLAAMTTSFAWLMTAIAIRCFEECGGTTATSDTDSLHVVAAKEAKTVIVNDGFVEIDALPWATVDEICDLFIPLNPFDRELFPGSPLRLTASNFDPVSGEQIAIEGLYISTKRYCRRRADTGAYVDLMETGIGTLVPPGPNFVSETWDTVTALFNGTRPPSCRWAETPAVRALVLATVDDYDAVKKVLPKLRPWDRYLVGSVSLRMDEEAERVAVVAYWSADPKQWKDLANWRLLSPPQDQEAVVDPDTWKLRTLREYLRSYASHFPTEMLEANGEMCTWRTRGVLLPRPVHDGPKFLMLKEQLTYGASAAGAFRIEETESFAEAGAPQTSVWKQVDPALPVIGRVQVAEQLGCPPTALNGGAPSTRAGKRALDPLTMAAAIVALSKREGLDFATDHHYRDEEICQALPHRARLVRLFAGAAAAEIADCLGGNDVMAERLGVAKSTIYTWIAHGRGGTKPIGDTNRILHRLAAFAGQKIRQSRRRSDPRIKAEEEVRTPWGDRRLICAYIAQLRGSSPKVLEELLSQEPEATLGFFGQSEQVLAALTGARILEAAE
jgi:hypothetical protein